MSAGLLFGFFVLTTAPIVLLLAGAAYTAHRRKKTVSLVVVSAAALALLLTWSALLLHGELAVGAVPSMVLSSVDAAAYLSGVFLVLAFLDALVIGEYLTNAGADTSLRWSAISCWGSRWSWPR
jgi:hypothetical protein